jgi:hypothetical protein
VRGERRKVPVPYAVVTSVLEERVAPPGQRAHVRSSRIAAAVESLAVAVSPGVLYAGLRLRGMGPLQLPDPAIHTTYILAPHDIFLRYQAVFTPTSRLREAARVGFLVPARMSYLLFGGVPGFFVFRYLLALIAIVPVYLLLRKLYGRWAGFVGIAIIMSSPVVITAWGTDYPDSAAVSYLTGALAALALAWPGWRWRQGWLVAAAVLLTMAVWAHGVSVPLTAVLLLVYFTIRLRRHRAALGRDVAVLALTAIATTLLLAIGSAVLIGQFNFITPTIKSALYLSKPSEAAHWHSASWRWAPYDSYLLVPPAIVLAFVFVFARRRQSMVDAQLLVGLAGGLQLALLVVLQFVGNVEALEQHYFSSTLWSSVNVMLAIIVAEVAAPGVRAWSARSRTSVAGWIAAAIPALLVCAVALAYEAAYKAGLHVPAMSWTPWGATLAAIIIAGALLGRMTIGHGFTRAILSSSVFSVVGLVIVLGAALVLTVAPSKPHPVFKGTVADPRPPYALALGGNDTAYVDEYKVVTEVPGFVGHASYRGEQLLTWGPSNEFGPLLGPMGLYHAGFNLLSGSFPVLGSGAAKIRNRVVAQVLIMSLTGRHLDQAVRSLAQFHPVVVRRATLRAGSYRLRVVLVDLQDYMRSRPAHAYDSAFLPGVTSPRNGRLRAAVASWPPLKTDGRSR